jgi:hypothetical protein
LVADSIVRRTVLGCYRTTAGSRTHGGLTIAALVHRSQIACGFAHGDRWYV